MDIIDSVDEAALSTATETQASVVLAMAAALDVKAATAVTHAAMPTAHHMETAATMDSVTMALLPTMEITVAAYTTPVFAESEGAVSVVTTALEIIAEKHPSEPATVDTLELTSRAIEMEGVGGPAAYTESHNLEATVALTGNGNT